MKEIILYIVVLVVLLLFLADTKISFNPFTFKVLHLWRAIGWLVIGLGVSMVCKDAENAAYKKGSIETLQEIDNQISKIIKK